LEGLDSLVGLQSLTLSSNQISKLEGLDGLVGLESLTLSSNQISKLEGLDGLVGLKRLTLRSNQISKLEGLDDLVGLQSLDLRSNQISKLEGLDGLVGLQSLDLSSNQISKLEGLDGLVGLQSLTLSSNQISKLEDLDGLVGLQRLDLNSNQINKLEGLDGLVGLQWLNLGSNQISKLEGLDGLVGLQSLFLRSNQISKLEGLDSLVGLQRLTLRSNQISKLEGLDSLVGLQRLDLWNNQISKLEGLDGLVGLQSLSLSSNQISKLEGLDSLVGLQRLDLSSNQISKLEGLDSLVGLQSLFLSSNQISKLEGLDGLVGLQWLNLGSNQISKLEGLDGLVGLEILTLGRNQISKLEGLDILVGLQRLDLWSNQISKLEGLDSLIGLQRLDLWSNQISKLEGLDGLVGLQSLDLRSNQISKLEGLDGLVGLESLTLSSNQISKLEGLDTLANLKALVLAGNDFQSLEGLKKIYQLKYIDVSRNPVKCFELGQQDLHSLVFMRLEGISFQDMPSEITQQKNCIVDLKSWLKALEENAIQNYEAKLIVAGNGRVGKTCLLKRFFYDTFDAEEDSTHGIQLHANTFTVEDEQGDEIMLKVNAWDFGGQEIYHATHRLFMQSRALYLVAWDEKTENEPKAKEIIEGEEVFFENHRLPYWLHKSRTQSYNSPLILVKTKTDMEGHSTKVPPEFEALQKEFKIEDHIPTSAALKKKSRQLRDGLLDYLREMPEVGMKMPASWMEMRERLVALSKTQATMTFEAYEGMCMAEGFTAVEANSLIRYLHNTGVLFFQESLFNRLIILDQKWALDGIYVLFQRNWIYEGLKIAGGKVNLGILRGYWPNHSEKDRKLLLSMMVSCEICFQIEEGKNPVYLIPEYLPDEPDKDILEFWERDADAEINLQYVYPFFHKAFMTRFISRAGRLAKKYDRLWKKGIWLTYNQTDALIRSIPSRKMIAIRVRGKSKKRLLAMIHKAFNEIQPSSNRRDLEIRVGLNNGAFIDYHELLKRKAKGTFIATGRKAVDGKNYLPFIEILNPEQNKKMKMKNLEDVVPPPPIKKVVEEYVVLREEEFDAFIETLEKLHFRDLDEAFRLLGKCLTKGKNRDTFMVLSASHDDLVREELTGTVDYEGLKVTRSQLGSRFLKFLRILKKEDLLAERVRRNGGR
ncbi:MAG: leucine-rich repeat domain-containing protein, partial [Bacteroidia bacterium]|nr:leucine-rich repeat domain-containing protein [Bacteroidia bacterium]